MMTVGSLSLAGLYACTDDDTTPAATTIEAGAAETGTTPDSGTDTGTTPVDGGADTGLAIDGICPSTQTSNPFCDDKVPLPQYFCSGVGPTAGDNGLIMFGDPDTEGKFCNNCVRRHCCDAVMPCYGNGKPSNDGGVATQGECIEHDICMFGCQGDPDAGGCETDCRSKADAGIVTIRKTAADCINNNCRNYPAFYGDGGTLCEQF